MTGMMKGGAVPSPGMTAAEWERRVSGKDCPFCEEARVAEPGRWTRIARMRVSSLYLAENQSYRGRCMLVLDGPHAVSLSDLDAETETGFLMDMADAYRAVGAVTGAHMNAATLGNQIPHLHFHLIPRRPGDANWGGAPWGAGGRTEDFAEMPDEERSALAGMIRKLLRFKGGSRTEGRA